ncbi:cytosolic carboxypeptidase 6 isoform X2 [Salvelinus sp. IW2-2015]|uniref:cytosolic carboxypeptidase 6 isoform X2 n=1 Tax=Salvelinus sp. IW2-2015 TaxID=2691554 RepID=UPI000CDFC2B3|nr:cytosolic carboxypeptidase 6 isoform X2 [Salvelinus alpinus]
MERKMEENMRDVDAGSEAGGEDALVGNVNKLMVTPPGYTGVPRKGHLVFDACFESGNLGRVDYISEFEFDLFIRPDTCNPRFRVWFNFTVENVRETQRVIFNIVNFSKTKSLYRDGMSPVVKSTSRPKWQRLPTKNVYYYRCPDHRRNYVMSFAFCFDREDDVYQFAYCYPYTYTRLQHYLDSLERRNLDYLQREQLGLSVQQRRLDLLTITSPDNIDEFEHNIMQKKMKIPKMSTRNMGNSVENNFGEERLPLRHKKAQTQYHGRPTANSSKSLAAVVARLERNAVSSCIEGEDDLEEDRLAELEEEGDSGPEKAVVPQVLYEELVHSYRQQEEEVRRLQQELERTRRQLVQQAKKLKEYGSLLTEVKELRDFNRRLQDVLLMRLGSAQQNPEKVKKLVVLTARVHPGESPASFICQGVIDFLVSQHPVAQTLRDHVIFKIVPMLNPDGVYLGNYRCSLMGFDLNRHWQEPSPWAHPTLHAVKQLIVQLSQDPVGLEFYIDVHAHSTMMNGFMYGNVFEEEERVQRQAVFPRLLCQNAPDFSFSNTSFNRDVVKAGTGRRFLGGLLDDTSYCYTLEVSFYSYMAAGSTSPVPYTEDTYMKLGRNVARTFLDYYRHNNFIDDNKLQIPNHINSMEVLSQGRQGNGNGNGRTSGSERGAERKNQSITGEY